ncbi:hypothetical protein [Pseudarthrobacter sp. NCCP-2145]|uniref:hypothetical protein n=1 Tax=Pseudarthrobacter sp. NCCP-2145 TaxID=2942290 RepID=UPI00203D95AA|nr:hypothetical protein [Pseudarthrobacter sp. NCCP-2145]
MSSQNLPSIYARLPQTKWLSQDFLRILMLRLVVSITPVQALVSGITVQLQSMETGNDLGEAVILQHHG